MNLEEISQTIEERKAIPIASEFCLQCMFTKTVGGLIFIPLEQGLSVNGKDYCNMAVMICSSCCKSPDQGQIKKNIQRASMEFNIEVL